MQDFLEDNIDPRKSQYTGHSLTLQALPRSLYVLVLVSGTWARCSRYARHYIITYLVGSSWPSSSRGTTLTGETLLSEGKRDMIWLAWGNVRVLAPPLAVEGLPLGMSLGPGQGQDEGLRDAATQQHSKGKGTHNGFLVEGFPVWYGL